MYEFGKLHNVEDEVTVFNLDDQLQKIETDTVEYFKFTFTIISLTHLITVLLLRTMS